MPRNRSLSLFLPLVFLAGFVLAQIKSTAPLTPVRAAGPVVFNTVGTASMVPAHAIGSGNTSLHGYSPSAADPEELASLDFEDVAFPPEGWIVADNITGRTGRECTHTWSRQTCQRNPRTGGDAAGWCSGGGLVGAKNACGANIGAPSEPWLFSPELDISAYPAGVQMQFELYFDHPISNEMGFRACAAAAGSRQFDCFRLTLREDQRAQWLVLTNPLYFESTAGLSDVQVVVAFFDKDGTGDYPGVFVDNIRIDGLAEAPGTPQVQPSATRRPTSTRTPTRVRFTATPTPRPTQSRRMAYLPFLSMNKEGFEPRWIGVTFGSEIGDQNHVSNPGKQFQFGTMSLCGEVAWGGFGPSVELRWQWYRRINGVFEEITSATLNGSVRVEDEPENFVSANCLAAVEDGMPAPLPVNDYKLAVFIEPETTAFTSESAAITDDVPPGKTPIGPRPTAGPTGRPSPTAKATPGGEHCQNVDNADFERGPSTGWSLRTNVDAPNDTVERVIRLSADVIQNPPAQLGEYLAVLGGGENVQDNLLSSEFPLPEASEIVSATLNFDFLMFTDETRDGTNDDIAVGFFMNQDGQAVAISGTGISEENIDPDRIYTLQDPVDVAPLITKRDGWTSAQLGFQSANSAADVSFHVFDNIEFALCTRSLFGLPIGWSARVPLVGPFALPTRTQRYLIHLDNLAGGPGVRINPAVRR